MKTSTKQTIAKIALGSLFTLICFAGAIHAQPSFLNETDFHEPDLEVEEWMTDTEAFDNIYTEKLLTIEDWMTDPGNLDNCNEEPLLALEDWMNNLDVFFDYFQPNNKMLFAELTEKPIKLERWMTNVDDFLAGPLHKLPNISSIDLNEFSPIMMALHIPSK